MKFKFIVPIVAFLALGCLPAFSQVTAGQIYTGLVSYWPLDVVDNGITPDISFTNDLTVFGNATTTNGEVGDAILFDGASVYLLNNHPPGNAATGLPIYAAGAYSVAFWVQGAAGQNSHYVYAEGSSTNNTPLFCIQTPNSASTTIRGLDVIMRNLSTTTINHVKTTNVVFDGTWHHVAFVDNRGSVKVYIDGNLDPANFSYTYTAFSAANPLNTSAVGALVRGAVSGFFNGEIDDVATWERPLSQAEVQYVMTNHIPTPIPPQPPSLQGAPLAAHTNALGDYYVVLSASAIGPRPLAYQWYENGQALAGETNATYLANTTNVSTNFYYAVISNNNGSITNGPVPVVILPDAAPDITSGLVSYWPFDSVDYLATVTNTPDIYFSNNIALINMNNNNLVPGEFGEGLTFDGATQYGIRGSSLPLYNLTNYTISMWVNGLPANNPAPNRGIYAEGNTNTATPTFALLTDPAGSGSLDVFIRNDASVAVVNNTLSSNVVFDGTWHHIIWVDQAGTAMLYVDGVLDRAPFGYPRASTTLNTATVATLWRTTLSDYFNGSIDEMAVWHRRLSYTEIQGLQTNTVPPPVVATPPSITAQPADQTNNIYAGDSVSFSVVASGTAPLSYQWYKNSQPISLVSNAGADTTLLPFPNAQASDSGSYYVIVTNVAGSVTSSVVQLTVQAYTPPTNGVVLALDFNAVATPATQPGFQMINLALSGSTFNNAVKVTISPIGGAVLTDRYRSIATGAAVTNDPPTMTQADLYNSFIFDDSTTPSTGIDILIQRLAPNTQYGVTIWSFDPVSGGARVSDWSEALSATNFVPPIDNAYNGTSYFFNGSTLPVADYDDTFGGVVTSSAKGALDIQGFTDINNTSFGAFINALVLVANPAPKIVSTSIAADGNIQIVAQAQYPGQSLVLYESADLSPGSWHTATDANIIATHGPMITVEFSPPAAATKMFYRAALF